MNYTDIASTKINILQIKKQSLNYIIIGGVTFTILILFFLIPNKWSSYFLLNIFLGVVYCFFGFVALFILVIAFLAIPKFIKCLAVIDDESKSLLFLEEIKINDQKEAESRELTRRKSVIIGHAYAVVSKDSQLMEIWFTEDETGWDLMEKFGWMQYKRVRKPYPSSTHDIHLVARNVELDVKLHKQLKDPFITDDERKLRREKYFRDTTTDYPFSIYAINYRLNKHLSTISVRHVDEEIYIARLVKDEFITVVKVCDKVKLSKAMTSSVYKVENIQ